MVQKMESKSFRLKTPKYGLVDLKSKTEGVENNADSYEKFKLRRLFALHQKKINITNLSVMKNNRCYNR